MFIFWKIQINSNENSKRKLIISTQSVMCSMSFVSVYWSWNTHMCQVICIPGMNFMKVHAFLLKGWFSSLNTNVLCVSWCQIERAARLRLWLGNLFHLHAIRDSKTWNDFDKFYNSLMTGKFFLFMASSFAWKTLIAFSFDPHSPFDKPKTLNYIEIRINFLLILGRF